ncbi:MAG TPA: shikimate kinase [Terriglobales bacterium]|nr:shikimate kinase [Terriglobales bacterium]
MSDAGSRRPEAGSLTPEARFSAIFLVGFMGAGKTSVGQALARRLGWLFEDLDNRIEQREGRSIAQIFRDSGENEFRRAEHAALRGMLQEVRSAPVVMALGGGAFVQPETAVLIAESGAKTVFLDAPIAELWQRSQEGPERPLRGDEQHFRHLYQRRRPEYMKASIRVDTGGKNVESVVTEIIQLIGLGDRDSIFEE